MRSEKLSGETPGSGYEAEVARHSYNLRQLIGLVLGPLLFLLMLQVPATESLTGEMRAVAASTCWMAAWWVTEAVPIPVASLLPLLLYPLTGALSFSQTAPAYADSNIFLFLGGFIIAAAMQKWNLHRRISLNIIRLVGTKPETLILGFMVSTGFLSMWISNTATAMMMMPIGLAVIIQLGELAKEQGLKLDTSQGKFSFGLALMLSIAYSATIGGVATLIGTPPNILLASALKTMYGLDISFAQWMSYGLPIAVLFMILAWLYLIRVFPVKELRGLQGGREVVAAELKKMGPLTKPELKVLLVFLLVALCWLTRDLLLMQWFPQLNDAIIAITGAIILFILPVNLQQGQFVMDWDTAVKIPWGILLLFGGGIAIAAGFSETGLALWLGERLGVLAGAPMLLVFLAIVTLVIFLTEVTSNTGTTSVMMPVMAAMAFAMAVHPLGLMIAAATAASFAFMLPVATPPNAVIFGSGYVTIPQMVRTGIWLNLLGILVITTIAYFWIPVAWGINLTIYPPYFH